MRHTLPRGVEPFTVSVQELDDALRTVMQCNQAWMVAVLDNDPTRDIHEQATTNAVAAYNALRDQAEREILEAHTRHRASIKAA